MCHVSWLTHFLPPPFSRQGADRRSPACNPAPFASDPAPTALGGAQGVRHDTVAAGFGLHVFRARSPGELQARLGEALARVRHARAPTLIDVFIDPSAGRESGALERRNHRDESKAAAARSRL